MSQLIFLPSRVQSTKTKPKINQRTTVTLTPAFLRVRIRFRVSFRVSFRFWLSVYSAGQKYCWLIFWWYPFLFSSAPFASSLFLTTLPFIYCPLGVRNLFSCFLSILHLFLLYTMSVKRSFHLLPLSAQLPSISLPT